VSDTPPREGSSQRGRRAALDDEGSTMPRERLSDEPLPQRSEQEAP
jgi:hypothetical protein